MQPTSYICICLWLVIMNNESSRQKLITNTLITYLVLSSWLHASNNFPNPSKFLFLSCSWAMAISFLESILSSSERSQYILASAIISWSVIDWSTWRRRAPSWSYCIIPRPLGSFLIKNDRTSSAFDPTICRNFCIILSTLALANWKYIRKFGQMAGNYIEVVTRMLSFTCRTIVADQTKCWSKWQNCWPDAMLVFIQI